MPKVIYLDYASTTPVDPLVLKAMLPYFSKKFGNSMSFHKMGAEAQDAVEKARKTIADIINANPSEIIFTSSATEANNLALKGVTLANSNKGKQIVISSIEHDSILNCAKFLEQKGFVITQLPVNKRGIISPADLEKALKRKTILVSIIHANNEIGVIQDIDVLGKICKKHQAYFHTDCSQSFTKIPLDVMKQNIDLLTASSHKIYGPKGAGFLYLRSGIPIIPLLHGGGHEYNLRPSTLNVPAIIGFAKAAEISVKNRHKENQRLIFLRDRLIKGILRTIPYTKLNGDLKKRLSNNVNISFSFIEGESLLLELGLRGIFVSTGSACSSPKLEPSNVLLALGDSPEDAHGSIRFSLGRWTTREEIDYVLKELPGIVKKLRSFSPFKKL